MNEDILVRTDLRLPVWLDKYFEDVSRKEAIPKSTLIRSVLVKAFWSEAKK